MLKFVRSDIILMAYIPPADPIYYNVDDFRTMCNILHYADDSVSVRGGLDINSSAAWITRKIISTEVSVFKGSF